MNSFFDSELEKLITFYAEDNFSELFFVSIENGLGTPQPLTENLDLDFLDNHCFLVPSLGPEKPNRKNPWGSLKFLSSFYEIPETDLILKLSLVDVRYFKYFNITFYSISDFLKNCI